MRARSSWSNDRRRPSHRLVAVLGLVLVAGVSACVNFVALFGASWSCSVGFDTGTTPPPAEASPQGWLCGVDASPVGVAIWNGGYVLSFLATVVLVAGAWRRWSWRGGLPSLALILLLPWAVGGLLDLPSDTCTPATRAQHDRGVCSRGG